MSDKNRNKTNEFDLEIEGTRPQKKEGFFSRLILEHGLPTAILLILLVVGAVVMFAGGFIDGLKGKGTSDVTQQDTQQNTAEQELITYDIQGAPGLQGAYTSDASYNTMLLNGVDLMKKYGYGRAYNGDIETRIQSKGSEDIGTPLAEWEEPAQKAWEEIKQTCNLDY